MQFVACVLLSFLTKVISKPLLVLSLSLSLISCRPFPPQSSRFSRVLDGSSVHGPDSVPTGSHLVEGVQVEPVEGSQPKPTLDGDKKGD